MKEEAETRLFQGKMKCVVAKITPFSLPQICLRVFWNRWLLSYRGTFNFGLSKRTVNRRVVGSSPTWGATSERWLWYKVGVHFFDCFDIEILQIWPCWPRLYPCFCNNPAIVRQILVFRPLASLHESSDYCFHRPQIPLSPGKNAPYSGRLLTCQRIKSSRV